MGLAGTHTQVFLAMTAHHKEGVCVVWEGFVSLPHPRVVSIPVEICLLLGEDLLSLLQEEV